MIHPVPHAISTIEAILPEPYAMLLAGMVLGRDLPSTAPLTEDLKRAGLIHIVVLSGSNVQILIALVWNLLAPLGRSAALGASIVTIGGFMILVGPDAPLLRATLMGTITLLGYFCGRKSVALLSLWVYIILSAVFTPTIVSTISFQLTVAATLGILTLAKPWMPDRNSISPLRTCFAYVITEGRTTIAATVVTTPILFLHFREISYIGPVANIAVSWILGPIFILGVSGAALSMIHPFLAQVPVVLTLPLLHILVLVTQSASALPFAFQSF